MQPTTFLYFAFGDNLSNHPMTNFSMLTIKKQSPPNSRFVIYTDRADFYKWSDAYVEVRPLDPKRLTEWKGKHNFVWRVKIMAMLDSAQQDKGHLFYLDSDTFALNDLSSMITKLEQGSCFMHVKESLLSEDKAKNKILMWSQTQNKKFGGMLVDKNSAMWNAGVIALNENSKIDLLMKALQSTDEMCEQKVEQWLIEQFSISQALSSSGKLEACDQWMAHYWGYKKEFVHKIENMFSSALQKNLSPAEVESQIDIAEWKKVMTPTPKKTFFQKLFKAGSQT